MCNLCTKISKLGSKASTKPLFTILHKLYKHVEPHLGDYWLWRLEKTERLRKLLVTIGADALVEDVDGEIGYIREEMVGHSLRLKKGRVEALRALEGEVRRGKRKVVDGKRGGFEDREVRKEVKAKRREASVRKVEVWLLACDVAMAMASEGVDELDSDEGTSVELPREEIVDAETEESDYLSETSSETSSLDSSRSSKTNMGSLLNWKDGSDDSALDSPPIPVIPEFARLVREEPRGMVSHYPQKSSKTEESTVLKKDWAREEKREKDEGVARARRRRRAERDGMALVLGAERFREDERRKFWIASR